MTDPNTCVYCGYRFSASDDPIRDVKLHVRDVAGVMTELSGPIHKQCLEEVAERAGKSYQQLLNEAT